VQAGLVHVAIPSNKILEDSQINSLKILLKEDSSPMQLSSFDMRVSLTRAVADKFEGLRAMREKKSAGGAIDGGEIVQAEDAGSIFDPQK